MTSNINSVNVLTRPFYLPIKALTDQLAQMHKSISEMQLDEQAEKIVSKPSDVFEEPLNDTPDVTELHKQISELNLAAVADTSQHSLSIYGQLESMVSHLKTLVNKALLKESGGCAQESQLSDAHAKFINTMLRKIWLESHFRSMDENVDGILCALKETDIYD